ncbi:MAG: ATP phosphoribosyltransferase, partial [Myxococcota bacterium]
QRGTQHGGLHRIALTVMESSTRLYANPKALDDPQKRERIETLQLLLRSVLEARARVMIECNVPSDKLDAVVDVLPGMRQPTIAGLHHGEGYAVKAAVLRSTLTTLIPEIKARGGSDIVVSDLQQIVP